MSTINDDNIFRKDFSGADALDDKTKAAAHGLTVATGAITGGVIGAAAGPVGIAVGAAVGGAVGGIGALIVWLRERNR